MQILNIFGGASILLNAAFLSFCQGIIFPQPTAPGPIYFSTAPGPDYFFTAPMYQNYFSMAPNDQNYYFTALVVENISCFSVLSKFQTFQLKEDKICNKSHIFSILYRFYTYIRTCAKYIFFSHIRTHWQIKTTCFSW